MRPHRLLSVLCLAGILGCHGFDDLARVDSAAPTPQRCGDCHVTIWKEWKESPHASAFVSSLFQDRTDGGRLERCTPCHAPAPLPVELGRAPLARASHRDTGVDCLACHRLPPDHAGEGASAAVMSGPLESHALVSPHPLDESTDRFRDPAFCGRCHADTLAETSASTGASADRTCQECHMPRVRRKVTQSTDWVSAVLVALEPELELRSHEFSAAGAVREADRTLGVDLFRVGAERAGDELLVTIAHSLPHHLPTGAFGAHRVEVRVLQEGRVIVRHALLAKPGRALEAGRELTLAIPAEALRESADLTVELVRTGGSDGLASPLVSRELTLPPAAESVSASSVESGFRS